MGGRIAREAVDVVSRRVRKQGGEGHRALLDEFRHHAGDVRIEVDEAPVRIAKEGQGEHGFRYGACLKQHIRVHREVLAVPAAAGAVGVKITVAVVNGDAHAVSLLSRDAHSFIHVDAVKAFDRLARALQHPHQDGLAILDDAGLPKASLVIDVQSPLVLRFGGQVEHIRAVGLEIADNFLQSGLTAALVLLRFVDHEAPEPVAIIRIFPFRIKGKHAEAHQLLICIDGKGPGYAGLLCVRLVRLSQRDVVRGDEGLILPHGQSQYGLPVGVVDGSQFYFHTGLLPYINCVLACSVAAGCAGCSFRIAQSGGTAPFGLHH